MTVMTTTTEHPAAPAAPDDAPSTSRPFDARRPRWEHVALYIFVIVPFLALIGGIAYAASGDGISWLDVGLSVLFVAITGHGITIGYHRYLTHGSFKAKRPLRIALAIAGSMALQGPP